MGTLFLTTDMSWEQLCGHFRVLFGLEDDVPIVLTYRNGWDAENGGGRSVLCTSATDLALLYDSVAKHPPPQGILKVKPLGYTSWRDLTGLLRSSSCPSSSSSSPSSQVKLLMATDEENSSDERQVEEMQANSRDRDSGCEQSWTRGWSTYPGEEIRESEVREASDGDRGRGRQAEGGEREREEGESERTWRLRDESWWEIWGDQGAELKM
eukprot:753350-Hanusia_phi.AAC.4